ncbi:hypothetical protein GF339_12850 [candidate division KSB3 bacterium]|uniref:peptidylprolyl isomerase n=1 Tax=candidate division KSB3 bacterium TaxID=2044937 RepID=A0A9D5JWA9_9BACT|nr:hypothetical protein [candidate division KSB3 bacterium]MBD3325472.1 hypothetical protein [candidate division KSB3 bacterium]
MAPGEISDLVRTPYGFHLIKVEEVREADDPYEEAKPEIIERLKLAEAKDIAVERAEIAYEDLLDTDNLAEVAAKDELEVQVSEFFARGEPIDKQTPALPQIQEVALTLTAEDKFSQPIETDQGAYLIEFVAREEPYIPELADIREDVAAAVRQEKARELAKAQAEQIRQALIEGTPAEEIAEQEAAVETFTTTPFSRRQRYIAEAQGNTEEFVKAAFALQDGEYSTALDLSGNYGVLWVADRTGLDMEQFEADKEDLRRRLLTQKQGIVLQGFIEELRQKADIQISPRLVS